GDREVLVEEEIRQQAHRPAFGHALDEGAAPRPGPDADQALYLERLERLAHRPLAGGELHHEFAFLRQAVAGRQPVLDDHALERLDDGVGALATRRRGGAVLILSGGVGHCPVRGAVRSRRGALAIKVLVYACRGDANKASEVPISTTSPRYMTATRSEMASTTARSWLMNR